ncbi:uncharacterized protein [Aegilops tauschii subsp. strangulata]|uniref:uncharacterized protein n=1 Tax=Aegilops tauschii subsp. strangulata TaxID=200361 RepID=UPI003CC8B2A5
MELEDTRCLFCNRNTEDGGHLFIRCKAVKEVWRALGKEGVRMAMQNFDAVGDVMDHLWSLPMEDRVQILYFWWEWWNERNRLRKNEGRTRPEEIVHRARTATTEYWDIVGKQNHSKPKEKTQWRPPEVDVLKFNFDGAFVPGGNQSAWGVIARDHTGDVVACMAGKCEHINDAFAAELQAAAGAMELATHLGAIRICLETDSQLLQSALLPKEPSFSAYASVLDDLKTQMSLWFSKCDVMACRREANAAAHELAKLGYECNVNEPTLWDVNVPPSVAGLIVKFTRVLASFGLDRWVPPLVPPISPMWRTHLAGPISATFMG